MPYQHLVAAMMAAASVLVLIWALRSSRVQPLGLLLGTLLLAIALSRVQYLLFRIV